MHYIRRTEDALVEEQVHVLGTLTMFSFPLVSAHTAWRYVQRSKPASIAMQLSRKESPEACEDE